MFSTLHFCNSCWLIKLVNSVFDSLSFRHSASIQDFTLSIYFLMVVMVLPSSLVWCWLKAFLIEWSSAKLLRLRFSITSGNFEVYVMNKNAPWTDPWGMLNCMVFSVGVSLVYVDLEFPGLEVIAVQFKCISIYSKFGCRTSRSMPWSTVSNVAERSNNIMQLLICFPYSRVCHLSFLEGWSCSYSSFCMLTGFLVGDHSHHCVCWIVLEHIFQLLLIWSSS